MYIEAASVPRPLPQTLQNKTDPPLTLDTPGNRHTEYTEGLHPFLQEDAHLLPRKTNLPPVPPPSCSLSLPAPPSAGSSSTQPLPLTHPPSCSFCPMVSPLLFPPQWRMRNRASPCPPVPVPLRQPSQQPHKLDKPGPHTSQVTSPVGMPGCPWAWGLQRAQPGCMAAFF